MKTLNFNILSTTSNSLIRQSNLQDSEDQLEKSLVKNPKNKK